jgi:hypothetical protein
MAIIVVADVVEVVIAEGCRETSTSSRMSVRQKTSPSGEVGFSAGRDCMSSGIRSAHNFKDFLGRQSCRTD